VVVGAAVCPGASVVVGPFAFVVGGKIGVPGLAVVVVVGVPGEAVVVVVVGPGAGADVVVVVVVVGCGAAVVVVVVVSGAAVVVVVVSASVLSCLMFRTLPLSSFCGIETAYVNAINTQIHMNRDSVRICFGLGFLLVFSF
jgi:hypothetical protein